MMAADLLTENIGRSRRGGSAEYRLVTAPQITDNWNSLVAGRHPTVRERWLRLAPGRLPGENIVFLLEKDGDVQVAVSGVVMDRPAENTRLDPQAIFSGAAAIHGLAASGPHPWHAMPAGRLYPCLLLMQTHYELVPVGPAADDVAACARLVSEIVRWAERAGIRSIAAQYLTPEAAALVTALRGAGFTVIDFASRCDLDVVWDDFDGYLATLPQRRRSAIRRELRILEDRGVRVVELAGRDREDELLALRVQLVAKYGSRPNPDKEAANLAILRREFSASELTTFAAIRAGKMMSFGIFAREGGDWIPMLTGSDYDDDYSPLTYFATLYYRPCQVAPAIGVTKMWFGLGSWEAKRLRGCRLRPLVGAARLVGGATMLGTADGDE